MIRTPINEIKKRRHRTSRRTEATKSFESWIGYAPCAINEGPIFTLKENKKHSDCFKDIVKILQETDRNQDIIRAKLEDYYIIEVLVNDDR